MGEPLKFEEEFCGVDSFHPQKTACVELALDPGAFRVTIFPVQPVCLGCGTQKGVLNGKFYGYERGIFHAEQDR